MAGRQRYPEPESVQLRRAELSGPGRAGLSGAPGRGRAREKEEGSGGSAPAGPTGGTAPPLSECACGREQSRPGACGARAEAGGGARGRGRGRGGRARSAGLGCTRARGERPRVYTKVGSVREGRVRGHARLRCGGGAWAPACVYGRAGGARGAGARVRACACEAGVRTRVVPVRGGRVMESEGTARAQTRERAWPVVFRSTRGGAGRCVGSGGARGSVAVRGREERGGRAWLCPGSERRRRARGDGRVWARGALGARGRDWPRRGGRAKSGAEPMGRRLGLSARRGSPAGFSDPALAPVAARGGGPGQVPLRRREAGTAVRSAWALRRGQAVGGCLS